MAMTWKTRAGAAHAPRPARGHRNNAGRISRELLRIGTAPQRLECFDISHTAGEGTVASCVVFGPKARSRRSTAAFNITGVTPGDDYGALRQALGALRAREGREVLAPDVLLIDGGLGRSTRCYAELEHWDLPVSSSWAWPRGPTAGGQERLFVHGEPPIVPGPGFAGMRVIQRIRDEAIASHHRASQAPRAPSQRIRAGDVPGLGPPKRRALAQALRRHAGSAARRGHGLRSGQRIGTTLARTLYDHLHPGADTQ
jgi:excinuclease ABC subunit C